MRKNKIIYNDFAALAAEKSTVPAESSSDYQDGGNLLDNDYRSPLNYASFEGQGINLLDPSLVLAEEGDNLGFISEEISNGGKSTNVQLVIDLADGYYSAPGITLYFHQNHCSEIFIEWQKDNSPVDSATTYPSSLSFYFEHKVEEFNKVILTFKKTETPFQFVKLAGIDLGRTRDITSFFGAISVFNEVYPDCSDLPGATCDFEALLTEDFTPQSEQEIFLYSDDELFGKFIVENATPNGNGRYFFECSDEIMKLEGSEFPELSQGSYTVSEIAEEIKKASNIEIDVARFGAMSLTGFIEKEKSSRLAATMLSFGAGVYIINEKKKLTLCKPRNRRNKVINSNQIIGFATYKQKSPCAAVDLQTFSGDFKTISSEKISRNPSKKASDSNTTKFYNKYSLISNVDSRFNELLEMGYHWNEIEADIILKDEKVGDILRIETPFNGVKTGIIKSMDCALSTEATAHIVIIERDYAAEGVEYNG
ncbi:MAG: hypothetical protein IKB88_02210 [Clostridia bacterium]|nr:hypothetical protein [Clostridia bacterium]